MSKYTEKTRKILPVTVRLKNITTWKRGQPDEFRRLENFLWNSYGPSLFVLTINYNKTLPNTTYMKKHPDAVWMRFRNEIFFKDEATRDLIIKYMPDEYKVVNYLS